MADLLAHRRRHGRLWLAALLCMCAARSASGAGFGAIAEHTLTFPPAAVTVVPGAPGSRSEILVLAKDRQLVAGHVVSDEGIIIETRRFRPPEPCSAIVPGDFNGDGKREFALLSTGGTRVHSYIRRPAGWISRRLPSSMRASKILSADLNADGFGDVLCYGKSMAGGIVFFGSRTGLGDSAFTVLGDVSIADAVASDVNGDGVPDLLVADWLGNSVTLFTGLDGVTFTETLKIGLPLEPLEVDLAEVAPGPQMLIAILLGDGSAIRTYSVRPGGEVIFTEELPLKNNAHDLRLFDSDGNRRPELMTATPGGVLLSELTQGGRFGPWTTYGISAETGSIVARDVDGDRKRDLVAAEAARRTLVVCANRSESALTAWPDAYVTPGEPTAALFSDVDLNGSSDLVVACRQPSLLAVLENDGRGVYSLAHTVWIPDDPGGMIAIPDRRGGRAVIVTSHAATNELGVISFDDRGKPTIVRRIATGDRPRLVAGVRDSSNAVQVLVLTGSMSSRGLTLTWFDELATGQFIEHPVSMPPQARILHAVAAGRNGASPAVAVLARVAGQEKVFAWRGRSMSTASDSVSVTADPSIGLLAGRLTPAGEFNMFVSGGKTGDGIAMWSYGGAQKRWATPVVKVGLSPDPRGVSVASDFTGDGRTDLLYTDSRRHMIVLLPAAGQGEFGDVRDIVLADRVRSVAVSDAVPGGGRDLAVLREGSRSVSILRGALTP